MVRSTIGLCQANYYNCQVMSKWRRVNPSVRVADRLRELAEAWDVSIATVVRRLLEAELERHTAGH